jgi:hypothetical protein
MIEMAPCIQVALCLQREIVVRVRVTAARHQQLDQDGPESDD